MKLFALLLLFATSAWAVNPLPVTIVFSDGTSLVGTSVVSGTGLSISNGTISLASSSTSTIGALSAADWNTFNSSVNLTSGVTGTLPVANGGIGVATLAQYGVLLGNGTGAVQVLAPDASTVKVLTSGGTGANPVWQAHPISQVVCDLANGFGTDASNRIRRWTTCVTTGTDVTYADVAATGSTFTINSAGVYCMAYTDQFNAANSMAIDLNASTLTTGAASLTTAQRLAGGYVSGANLLATAQTCRTLAVNDVIRQRNNSSAPSGTQTWAEKFTISKVSH